jgi:(4S)-4-hydroxy-5-phosphonooxypentane-2,3-dione isomerase
MSGYVVIVDFQLRDGKLSDFRGLIDANSRTSMQLEQGCLRFDVVEPVGEPDRVMLYEIYDDQAAFEAHCRTDHFLKFDAESAALVRDKKIIKAQLVCGG